MFVVPSVDEAPYNEKISFGSRLMQRFRPAATPRDPPSDSYVGVPSRVTYGRPSPEAFDPSVMHIPTIIYGPSSATPTSPSPEPIIVRAPGQGPLIIRRMSPSPSSSPQSFIVQLPDTNSPPAEPAIIMPPAQGQGQMVILPSPSSPRSNPPGTPSRRSQFVTTTPRRSRPRPAPPSPPQVVVQPVHPPYPRSIPPHQPQFIVVTDPPSPRSHPPYPRSYSPHQPQVIVVANPPSPRSPPRDRKSRGPSKSRDLDLAKGRLSTRKATHQAPLLALEKAHFSPPSLEPETTRPRTRRSDQARASSHSRGRLASASTEIAGPLPDRRRAGRSSLGSKVPSSGATRRSEPAIVNLPSPKSYIIQRPPRRSSPPIPVVRERSPETRNPGTVTIIPSPPRQFAETMPEFTREARSAVIQAVPPRPVPIQLITPEVLEHVAAKDSPSGSRSPPMIRPVIPESPPWQTRPRSIQPISDALREAWDLERVTSIKPPSGSGAPAGIQPIIQEPPPWHTHRSQQIGPGALRETPDYVAAKNLPSGSRSPPRIRPVIAEPPPWQTWQSVAVGTPPWPISPSTLTPIPEGPRHSVTGTPPRPRSPPRTYPYPSSSSSKNRKREAPSAEYLAMRLSGNPLGLTGMVPV